MSFEIKQKTLVRVKIYGEEFELRKPTVGQIEEIEEASSDAKTSKKGSKIYEKILGLLDTLGLPRDFAKEMEIDHLNQLMEHLTSQFNGDAKKK